MGSKEDGTKYITIFRDPVDLLESAWGFYSFETKFGISLGDNKYTLCNMKHFKRSL